MRLGATRALAWLTLTYVNLFVFVFHRLFPFLDDSLDNVYIQRGRVRQVPEPRLVGHHVVVVAVLLPVGWLTQIDLFKLQQVAWLKSETLLEN